MSMYIVCLSDMYWHLYHFT